MAEQAQAVPVLDATASGRRYAVITPCRNEAEFLPVTIETMLAQSVLPAVWVIVDDGSTDGTTDIIRAAAAQHPWIRLVQRKDRGARAVGGGVVEAFNDGLAAINLDEYDYLCKLDADLGLPPTYFETLMEKMEAEPLQGNLSGKTYIPVGRNRWVSERMGDENAVGPAKFYRTACYRDIGGFIKRASWDGIDGHRCRMLGWIAGSIDEEPLRLKHYRPQGSSQVSVWTGRKRWGRGKYFMGSSLLYVTAVAVYRMAERPFVLGGVGILVGYLQAWIGREERYGDHAYLRHFRRYEFQSLIRGKRRTMHRYNERIRAKAQRENDPRLATRGATA